MPVKVPLKHRDQPVVNEHNETKTVLKPLNLRLNITKPGRSRHEQPFHIWRMAEVCEESNTGKFAARDMHALTLPSQNAERRYLASEQLVQHCLFEAG